MRTRYVTVDVDMECERCGRGLVCARCDQKLDAACSNDASDPAMDGHAARHWFMVAIRGGWSALDLRAKVCGPYGAGAFGEGLVAALDELRDAEIGRVA